MEYWNDGKWQEMEPKRRSGAPPLAVMLLFGIPLAAVGPALCAVSQDPDPSVELYEPDDITPPLELPAKPAPRPMPHYDEACWEAIDDITARWRNSVEIQRLIQQACDHRMRRCECRCDGGWATP